MTMTTLTYTVSFNTPAFLGNAQQQAQWRTPPFKALLRQWWRVVKAPEVDFDHRELLRQENALFGSAGDGDGEAGRSRVQLRLSGWDEGTLTSLPKMATHQHPEVKDRQTGQLRPIDSAVYLGFGPVTTSGNRNAIAPEIPALTLKLRFPASQETTLRKAMQLAAWFGTLGSRSRNGWGSLHIEGDGILGWADLTETNLRRNASASTLQDALRRDWAHGFGLIPGGRVAAWRVARIDQKSKTMTGFSTWREAMEELARIKIKFRTDLKFPEEATPHPQLQDRHVLGFPVTNHGVRGISNDKRLAGSLRFKVHKHNDTFFALITHLPCGIPSAFMPNPPGIDFQHRVWEIVHQSLSTQFNDRVTYIKKGGA